MASRRIEDLRQEMRERAREFSARCAIEKFDALVYCTLRSGEDQARIWRRGRSRSAIDSTLSKLRDYQARVLAEIEAPTSEEIAWARLAHAHIEGLRESTSSEDRVVVARVLNWTLGWVQTVGPQSGAAIRTHALPGRSAHQYGVAMDAVPMSGGKPLWDDDVAVDEMGHIGEESGLEWAGRWTKFRERVHFQLPNWRDALMEVGQ